MILDDLIKISGPRTADFLKGAFVVRVPWKLFPDGDWTADFIEKMPVSIVPKEAGSISWREIRLPYPRIIMCSAHHEQGLIFVQEQAHAPITALGRSWSRSLEVGVFHVWKDRIGYAPFRYAIFDSGTVGGFYANEQGFSDELEWRLQQTLEVYRQLGHAVPPGQAETTQRHLLESKEAFLVDATNFLIFVTAMATLMNCKNVVTVRREHDAAIQRKRGRRGHLPLYAYHELLIRGQETHGKANVLDGAGLPVAIHWVRGHFKRYTKDAPLFGRMTGMFWWQPHVAGRAERFVDKDYRVEES